MMKEMFKSENIEKRIIKNAIFVIFVLCVFLSWIRKDISLQTDIVSHPDTVVRFSNGDILEQTWLSDVKEIKSVGIPYFSHTNAQCDLQLTILESSTKKELVNIVQNVEFGEGESGRIGFLFEPVKINLGEQYVFCLQYVNNQGESIIDIDAGSNHMGCKISGVEQKVGAALQISFIKTSLTSWVILTLFPFAALSFFLMMFFDRKWEDTIGISVIASIFLLFVMGMLNKLELGIGLLYAIAFASLILGIYLFNKKDISLKELLSPGIFVFGILLVLILINCQELRLARWDEFSHWGLAVKDMFYSDSLAKHVGTTVMLVDYPPATTLIQYFFMYVNRIFSQKFMYVGFQFLICSLLLVALEKVENKKKSIAVIFALVIVIVCVPITYFADTYNCLYADSMLAYGVAYVLICYYHERFTKFNTIRIIGGLFLITMTKHTGLIIAGVVTLIILGDVLYRQYCERKLKIKDIGIALGCAFMVLLFFVTWQKYLSIPAIEVKAQEVSGQEIVLEESRQEIEMQGRETEEVETVTVSGAVSRSGISMGGILALLRGQGQEYQYQIIINYIQTLFSANIFVLGPIQVSYMDLFFILILACLVYSRASLGDGMYNELISYSVLTGVTGMAYVIFLLVAYMFTFAPNEGLLLASWARYIGSYLVGVLITLFVRVIEKSSELKGIRNRNLCVLSFVVMMVLIATPFEYFFIRNVDTELTEEEVYGFSDIEEILSSGAKREDKVYFVCNNSGGYAGFQMRNQLVPLNVHHFKYDICPSKEYYYEQLNYYAENEVEYRGNLTVVSPEEWKTQLQEYQYVVLFAVNKTFKEGYRNLFIEPETLDNGTIYQVKGKESELYLDYVGKVGIKNYK